MITLTLLITLLKLGSTDFKQMGHNIKKVEQGLRKAPHKIVQVLKHV